MNGITFTVKVTVFLHLIAQCNNGNRIMTPFVLFHSLYASISPQPFKMVPQDPSLTTLFTPCVNPQSLVYYYEEKSLFCFILFEFACVINYCLDVSLNCVGLQLQVIKISRGTDPFTTLFPPLLPVPQMVYCPTNVNICILRLTLSSGGEITSARLLPIRVL